MSRITGLATGLDVDAVVKETMQAYRTQIDTVGQEKALVELQQTMYREVITECRDFYNKYFDLGKPDSLLLSKNWATAKFESSNPAVTVTGGAEAEATNYTVTVDKIAKPASYQLTEIEANSVIYINNIKIDLTGKDNKQKVEIINEALKDQNITAKYSEFTNGIVLSTKETGKDKVITIGTTVPAEEKINKTDLEKAIEKFNTNGTSFKIGGNNVKEILIEEDANSKKVNISVGGTIVASMDKDGGITKEKLINTINSSSEFKKKGISITENKSGEISVLENTSIKVKKGQNCKATLTNVDGKNYSVDSASNSITVDGVTFKFNNDTKGTGPVQITGKTDTSAVKDKIVHFVNDYNKLIVKLNTLTSEKRNRDYMPLTDAQKKEMSEKEIELWEAKVKQGQLSRDSDLTRICNSMKKAMRDLVTGVSGDLEKFGIKPVEDYSGNNNGTFSIDEDKLNSALENNIEDVKNIFISNGKDYKEKGIVYRLKEILDNETQKSSSSLLQKAGMEGSATASNNTLSRKITAYEKRIKELESNFARREQALYSKYATLETMMNNLNAQMSSLSSMFS